MLLTEIISSIVYHYTSIQNAASILSTNTFKLSPAIAGIESSYQKNNKYYFLSTTRSRTGGFHYDSPKSAVLFKLNGTKLSQNYTGSPVKYFSTPRNNRDESEDRIQTSTPTIPAKPYIEEVSILYNVTYHASQAQNSSKLFGQDILLIINICEKNNIPYYIFSNMKDFLHNIKKNAINPNRDSLNKEKEHKKHFSPKEDYAINVEKLLSKSNNDTLSYSEKSILINDITDLGNNLMFYYKHFPDRVNNIINMMKKNKLKNVPELITFLQNKWTPNAHL